MFFLEPNRLLKNKNMGHVKLFGAKHKLFVQMKFMEKCLPFRAV